MEQPTYTPEQIALLERLGIATAPPEVQKRFLEGRGALAPGGLPEFAPGYDPTNESGAELLDMVNGFRRKNRSGLPPLDQTLRRIGTGQTDPYVTLPYRGTEPRIQELSLRRRKQGILREGY